MAQVFSSNHRRETCVQFSRRMDCAIQILLLQLRIAIFGIGRDNRKDLIGRLVKVHIGENNKVEKISRVYENDVLDELADEFIEWLEKEKGITTMEELEYFMKHNKMPEVKVEKEQALLF